MNLFYGLKASGISYPSKLRVTLTTLFTHHTFVSNIHCALVSKCYRRSTLCLCIVYQPTPRMPSPGVYPTVTVQLPLWPGLSGAAAVGPALDPSAVPHAAASLGGGGGAALYAMPARDGVGARRTVQPSNRLVHTPRVEPAAFSRPVCCCFISSHHLHHALSGSFLKINT